MSRLYYDIIEYVYTSGIRLFDSKNMKEKILKLTEQKILKHKTRKNSSPFSVSFISCVFACCFDVFSLPG